MKINIENDITAELLLQGIKFHRETNKDKEVVQQNKRIRSTTYKYNRLFRLSQI